MKRSEFIRTSLLALGSCLLPSSLVHAEKDPEVGENIINPHFVNRGNGFGNRIALTYDDGPSPGVTEPILDELDKYGLRATFFMIGQKVKMYPELTRKVAERGHEIANHTYTHRALNKLSDAQVDEELYKTQEIIFQTVGKYPVWFRPPYGAFRKEQGRLALSRGLGIAYWSVDPRDWTKPGPDVIASRVLDATNAGSIVLLHDLHKQTAEASVKILPQLKERSFALAKMSHFIGLPYV